MKNARALLIATIVISVFLLSFLIGRATALRSKEENSSENKIYMGTVTIPKKEEKEELTPAAAKAKVLEESKADFFSRADKLCSRDIAKRQSILKLWGTGVHIRG